MVHFGMLVAPPATPLYARMKQTGRIASADHIAGGNFFQTNIEPLLMSREELIFGSRWLLNQIFSPEAFAYRLAAFAALCGQRKDSPTLGGFSPADRQLAARLASFGASERRLVQLIERIAWQRPDISGHLSYFLLGYCQVRYIFDHYGVWDPELRKRRAPLAA
jgi:hypothetical protein